MDRGQKFRTGVAFVAAVAAVLGAPIVVAEVDGPVAQVVRADRQTPRVGAEGQARVVPLSGGERGYLGEFTLAAGAEHNPEARDDEQYLYVLSGSAVLEVDGQSFVVGPRMGIFLPADATVTWTNGSQRLVAVHFQAGPSAGAEFDQWELDDPQVQWPRPRIRPRPKRSTFSMGDP